MKRECKVFFVCGFFLHLGIGSPKFRFQVSTLTTGQATGESWHAVIFQVHWLAKETQLKKIFSKLSSKPCFERTILGPSVPCMTTRFINAFLNPPAHRLNEVTD